MPNDKPLLNLGCGHIIMPREKPAHHALVDDALYLPKLYIEAEEAELWVNELPELAQDMRMEYHDDEQFFFVVLDYPLGQEIIWHNVDMRASDGVDEVVDLFRYPWPWASNRFGGALLSHLAEHIPHEIRIGDTPIPEYETYSIKWQGDAVPHWFEPELLKTAQDNRIAELQGLGDGFYAFFSELWRVCEPGSIAHILSPYAWSLGAMMDPTHTRYLVPSTFGYLSPDPNAPFEKNYGSHWEIVRWSPMLHSDYNGAVNTQNGALINHAWEHQLNVCTEFYIQLRSVKNG